MLSLRTSAGVRLRLLPARNRSIELGNHIGMRPLRVVIPVMDRPDGLRLENGAGFQYAQLKLAPSAPDGPKRTETTRQERMRWHRNIKPAVGKSALAPPPFIGN